MSNDRVFSYRFGTVFWAFAVVAVFCSAFTWMGLTGLMIFVVIFVGTCSGLIACAYFDFNFEFTDLRVDLLKCLVVAAVMSGMTYGIIIHVGFLGGSVMPIAWLITVKLCWFELENAELMLMAATMFAIAGACAVVCTSFLMRAV